MRIIPFITAGLVVVGLFLLLFEREPVMDFARNQATAIFGGSPTPEPPDAQQAAQAPAQAETGTADEGAGTISVIAVKSVAQEIDSAVLLHGRTEASRQVMVKAETSGQVISPPRAKGSWVEEGDVLCELDPGTREAALSEALARLAEARARVPEARARVAEAESRVPAVKAALAEAKSRVPTARAGLANAESQVTAAEASLADAEARLPAAQARVAEARARLNQAQADLERAQKLKEGGYASQARVDAAQAALESARAGLEGAISQLESARAGVELAKSKLEGARAGVESAKSQIEAAQAGVESAKSQIEAAAAGVQSAQSGVENAKAGVRAAEARVASVRKDIENLTIRAPFAGLLESDAAELGSLLQPGAPCATLVQLDPIKLVGYVPEADVDKVRLGVGAGGRLNSGRELVGKVSFVSRVSDPLTRTFRVEIEVPNPEGQVSDGLSVEMLVPSAGRMAHLLPASALTLDDDGRLGVRVAVPGQDGAMVARFAPVDLIRDTVDGVWVAGLPDQAAVIVVGQNYVTDGVALDVTWREPGT